MATVLSRPGLRGGIALAAACLGFAARAWAQAASATILPAPPSTSIVEDLVRRALENAPSVAARQARLAAAQAALKAADTPPDPMVELEFRNAEFPKFTVGSDPMSMVGATLRQTLLGKGRRAARRQLALADIDVRHAETDATACDLTAAVRTAFGEIYAIDQERRILRDAAEMARLLVETATARYAAGGSDQASVLRAQLEGSRLSERAVDLDADRAVKVAVLNRLLNQPPGAPFSEVRTLPDPPALAGPLSVLPDAAAAVAPEVAVRRAEVEAAARRVESAREELRPTYTLGGSLFYNGSAYPFAAFTVGVEWPARKERRQLPQIAASEHELRAARLDLEDMTSAMRADAARLTVEIARSSDQVTRYREGLLPQSSAALDAARESYLSGRGDFASVLDAFRRWTDVRVDLARRQAAWFVAQGQLDVLVNPSAHDIWERAPAKAADASKEPRS